MVSIFFLTPRFVSHLSIGHIGWLTLAYLPWIFLFFLKSLEKFRFLPLAALLSALALLEGGQHIFIWINFLLGVYSIFLFVEKKKLKIFYNLIFFFLMEILFGAIKIFPMVHFFSSYKIASITPEYTFKTLWHALNTAFLNHDQGNYIGIIPIIIFIITIFYGIKRNTPIALTSLFFFLLSIKIWNISLFQLINKLPILYTQRVPPRFLIICFFLLSILSGLLFTDIAKLTERLKPHFRIPIILFLSALVIYTIFDLNMKSQRWYRFLWKYHFEYGNLNFSNYLPTLLSKGKLETKFASPNIRIWKPKINQNSIAHFKELNYTLYKNIVKFKIFRKGKFERISPKNYEGAISILIPRDTQNLAMEYNSPYFYSGMLISILFLLFFFFYFFYLLKKKS